MDSSPIILIGLAGLSVSAAAIIVTRRLSKRNRPDKPASKRRGDRIDLTSRAKE